jgi:hypothetical protein
LYILRYIVLRKKETPIIMPFPRYISGVIIGKSWMHLNLHMRVACRACWDCQYRQQASVWIFYFHVLVCQPNHAAVE